MNLLFEEDDEEFNRWLKIATADIDFGEPCIGEVEYSGMVGANNIVYAETVFLSAANIVSELTSLYEK